VEHSNRGAAAPLVCTVTLVEKKSTGNGYVECPVLVKRTGAVEYVPGGQPKSSRRKPPAAAATQSAKTARCHVDSSSESSDDDDDDEDTEEDEEVEVVETTRQLRNQGKGEKNPAGGDAKRQKLEPEKARKTRGSSKVIHLSRLLSVVVTYLLNRLVFTVESPGQSHSPKTQLFLLHKPIQNTQFSFLFH